MRALVRNAGAGLATHCPAAGACPGLSDSIEQDPGRNRLRLLRPVAVLVAELLRGGRRGRQPAAMQSLTPLRFRRAWVVATIRARLSRGLPDRRHEGARRDGAVTLRPDAVRRPDPARVEGARRLLRSVADGLF